MTSPVPIGGRTGDKDPETNGPPAKSVTASWAVSARHRSSAAVKPALPFGVWHARQPGDPFTACGLPAAGWPIFWELTFAQGRSKMCAECQAVMYSCRAE